MTAESDQKADWLPDCFNVLTSTDDHIKGWVSSEKELTEVLEAHRRSTLCTFVYKHDDGKIREKSERRYFWNNPYINEENVPYCVRRTIFRQCQYGSKHRQQQETAQQVNDHTYKKSRRKSIQPSRKVNCSAKISVRYFETFPAYEVQPKVSRDKKEEKLDELRHQLQSLDKTSLSVLKIFISLPLPEAHTNHTVSIESGFANRLHEKIINKIEELVESGIVSVPYIRKALRHYVQKDLCAGDKVQPEMHDRAYYPTRHDIRNHVHKFIVAGRLSNLDQENLEKKIEQWRTDSPLSKFFFRPCIEKTDNLSKEISEMNVENAFSVDNDDEDQDNAVTGKDFLFVHQESWQQHLLIKYGNTLSLLDATYKTTRYAMPLFFLCVRTNVGYLPVAEFMCQHETHKHIEEALSKIKSWNDEWNPPFFMTDYSEGEHLAIKSVFPKCEVYPCSFHREQAWERWSKDGKNGLSVKDRIDFLEKLRAVANSLDIPAFNLAVNNLEDRPWFKSNTKARNYIQNKWLKISKVMQAYLGLLMLEKNREEPNYLLVLPSFLATKWQQGRYNEWLLLEIAYSRYQWILMPVCTHNHWVLLVDNMQEHTFAVLNSMKRAYAVQREMFTHWLMYMTCRQKKTQDPFVKWTCIEFEEEQQRDGHSCGPFALMYAEALLSKSDVTIVKQHHISDARQYIQTRLVNAAKMNDRSVCDLPFCEGSERLKNSDLIECTRCNGLIHSECANAVTTELKDYACLSCEQAEFNTCCNTSSDEVVIQ